MRCACVRDDASDCAIARYGNKAAGEPCECCCHEADAEWDVRIADEFTEQVLATPDKDVLTGNWPPLVKGALDRK